MDLAYIDKLAKDNKGVKNILVRQDLFDRTVDAKEMKIKDFEEPVLVFLTLITKMNRRKKLQSTKEHNFLEIVKKLAKLKEYKVTAH